MSKSSIQACGEIGFLPLLGPAFIILKLTGSINWDWWIVLTPLWASLCSTPRLLSHVRYPVLGRY